jgi:hypothetical protein
MCSRIGSGQCQGPRPPGHPRQCLGFAAILVDLLMSWLRKRQSSNPGDDAELAAKRTLIRRKTRIDDEVPPGHITGEAVLAGLTVSCAAKCMVHRAIVRYGRPPVAGTIRVASLCSGSEMVSVVLDAINQEFIAERIGLRLYLNVACVRARQKKEASELQAISQILTGSAQRDRMPERFLRFGQILIYGTPINQLRLKSDLFFLAGSRLLPFLHIF